MNSFVPLTGTVVAKSCGQIAKSRFGMPAQTPGRRVSTQYGYGTIQALSIVP